MAAAGVAVAAVVGAVAVALPRSTAQPPSVDVPSTASRGAARGTGDGVHPLWPITVRDVPRVAFADLPAGEPGPLPVPHVVNLGEGPRSGRAPVLVTGTGNVLFHHTESVQLLARHAQGTFVLVLVPNPGRGGDLSFDRHLVLVAPDGSRRELLRVDTGTPLVSPDGTTVAVLDHPLTPGRARPEVAVVVDVASGRVLSRLDGTFSGATWLAGDVLLLRGPTDLRWRAPWTGPAEPVRLPDASPLLAVPGGAVGVDDRGCLFRVDTTAAVTAANCGEWSIGDDTSPDGRYLAISWGSGGTAGSGALDVTSGDVRPWPFATGDMAVAWLGGPQALLRDVVDDDDQHRREVRCDPASGACARLEDWATGWGAWQFSSWLGGGGQ